MKRVYSYLICIFALISVNSCNDFMEFPPAADLNVDKIFQNYTEVEKLVYSMYCHCVPLYWDVNAYGSAWGGSYSRFGVGTYWAGGGITDETQQNTAATSASMLSFYRGNITSSNCSEDDYSWHWKTLRKAFVILESINKVPDATIEQIKRVEAEAKLMVAVVYFEMWKRYGGVPLVDFAYTGGEPLEEINKPRATFEEIYNYIITLLDDVMTNYEGYLPAKVDDIEFGRFPMALAYALKARVLLYAASPLFNTNQPYSMELGEQSNLICFMKPYDKERWKAAADAASAAISYCESHGYAIVDDPAKREDGWNYTIATQEFPTKGNTELIWGIIPAEAVNNYFKLNMSVKGLRGDFTTSSTTLGVGVMLVTMNQVMRYEIDDDKTPGQYPDWTVKKEYPIEGEAAGWFSKTSLTTAQTNTAKLAVANAARRHYEDVRLDPRFYASIIYNGDPNYGSFGPTGDVDMAEAYVSGTNAAYTGQDGTCSDRKRKVTIPLYPRKLQRGHETRIGELKALNIYFRLGELYLIRAEANNEYYGSPAEVPSNQVYSDLAVIRNRSGMVNVKAGSTQDEMRQLIAHERQIEFFFEDQRWFDLRRTKRAEFEIPVLIYKPVIKKWYKASNTKVPTKISYELDIVTDGNMTTRYWNNKMYMNPIPKSEMNKFYGLVQNPGWE